MAEDDRASNGTASQALRRMAESDPELAARLIVQSLPAATASLPPGLTYRLELEELGAWRVSSQGGRAEISEVPSETDLNGDDFAISTVYPAAAPVHVAFAADSEDEVRAFHAAALEAGGRDNGAPGPRQYHDHYYGAFLLDPDGNNVEAVCHTPPA